MSENSAGSILSEALKIVTGDRQLQHGPKKSSFNLIANLWNVYLQGRKTPGPITASDACFMMAMLKMARSVQGLPMRDHYLDAAAYCALAWEVQEKQP